MEIDHRPDGFSGRERMNGRRSTHVQEVHSLKRIERSVQYFDETLNAPVGAFPGVNQAKRKSLPEKFAAASTLLGSSTRMEKAFPVES